MYKNYILSFEKVIKNCALTPKATGVEAGPKRSWAVCLTLITVESKCKQGSNGYLEILETINY